MKDSEVASPCVRNCCLDPESGWCMGCGRTIEEITGWMAASSDERRAILARLPDRNATLAARNDWLYRMR